MGDGVVCDAPLLRPNGHVNLLFGQLEVSLELEGDALGDDLGRRGGGKGIRGAVGGGARRGAVGRGRGGGGEESGEGIDQIAEEAHRRGMNSIHRGERTRKGKDREVNEEQRSHRRKKKETNGIQTEPYRLNSEPVHQMAKQIRVVLATRTEKRITDSKSFYTYAFLLFFIYLNRTVKEKKKTYNQITREIYL